MITKEVEWTSSKNCDFCHNECKDVLYDAVTIHGPWATMCQNCYNKHATHQLGLGFGQKYQKNSQGRFIKILG